MANDFATSPELTFPTHHSPSWASCLYYDQLGHSYHNCANLGFIQCFRCQCIDHFRGKCCEEIRFGNPRLDKDPTTMYEMIVQRDEYKARCHQVLPHFSGEPKTLEEALAQLSYWKTCSGAVFTALQTHGFHEGMFYDVATPCESSRTDSF
jgi:hypothetical protein